MALQQQAKPVGFRIDIDFGPTNDAVHYLDAGTTTNFLQQAYVTTVLPLGKGLTLDIGKFVTHMGYEVIESKDNWNYTRSILFGYAIPFFHTGARASYPAIDDITLTGYIYNGWDRGVTDNNTKKTFGGTVNIAAIPATTVILNWIGGPELDDGSDQLHVFDIILSHTLAEQTSVGLNADYGFSKWEGGTSVWKGAALYGKTLVTDLLTLAARAEYFVDQNGVRTGAIQDVKELTLTFEYKFLQDLLTRFEIRRDVCTIPFFENKHIQDTFLLGTILSF